VLFASLEHEMADAENLSKTGAICLELNVELGNEPCCTALALNAGTAMGEQDHICEVIIEA
jgi:hypothetical protein